jgi:hypothetical protein
MDIAYLPCIYCPIKIRILGGEIIPLDHDVHVCGPIYVGMGMYVVVNIWWNNGENMKSYLTLLLEGILLSFEL